MKLFLREPLGDRSGQEWHLLEKGVIFLAPALSRSGQEQDNQDFRVGANRIKIVRHGLLGPDEGRSEKKIVLETKYKDVPRL